MLGVADPLPLHGSSLHDGVLARLRDRVFDRQLAPGSFIDELALVAEGLVELTPQRGCRQAARAHRGVNA